jgi:hypothetical protein
MELGFASLLESKKWDFLFSALLGEVRSPFFSTAYYASYAQLEKAEVLYFWAYKDENNYMFYPYLMRSINNLGYDLSDEYHDISGAYGYN